MRAWSIYSNYHTSTEAAMLIRCVVPMAYYVGLVVPSKVAHVSFTYLTNYSCIWSWQQDCNFKALSVNRPQRWSYFLSSSQKKNNSDTRCFTLVWIKDCTVPLKYLTPCHCFNFIKDNLMYIFYFKWLRISMRNFRFCFVCLTRRSRCNDGRFGLQWHFIEHNLTWQNTAW